MSQVMIEIAEYDRLRRAVVEADRLVLEVAEARRERDRAIHERDQARRLADVRLGDIDTLNGELQRQPASDVVDRVEVLEQCSSNVSSRLIELGQRLTALEAPRRDPREPVSVS